MANTELEKLKAIMSGRYDGGTTDAEVAKVKGVIAQDYATRLNNYSSNRNSYIDAYKSRFFNEDGTFKNAYRNDTEDWYEITRKMADENQQLKNTYHKLRHYYGDEWADSVKAGGLLDDDFEQILSVAKQDRDFYSQFEDEEDYGYWQKYHGMTDAERTKAALDLRANLKAAESSSAASPDLIESWKREQEWLANKAHVGAAKAGVSERQYQIALESGDKYAAAEYERYEQNSNSGYDVLYDALQSGDQQYETYVDPETGETKTRWITSENPYSAEELSAMWAETQGKFNQYLAGEITLQEFNTYLKTLENNPSLRKKAYFNGTPSDIRFEYSGKEDGNKFINQLYYAFQPTNMLSFANDFLDDRESGLEPVWGDGSDAWFYADQYKYMTDDEIAVYSLLADEDLQNGTNKAEEYLLGLSVTISQRKENQEFQEKRDFYANAPWWQMIPAMAFESIVSVPMGYAERLTSSVGLLATAAGKDYNWHAASNYSSNTRGAIAEGIDDRTGAKEDAFFTLGDAYQTGMSIADVVAGIYAGGNLFGNPDLSAVAAKCQKIASTVYQLSASSGAAADKAKELYQKGASNEQILFAAGVAGAAEYLCERFSIEKLLREVDVKYAWQIFAKAVQQGGFEALEEGATEFSNLVAGWIIMNGHDDYSFDVKEAAKEITQAALSGFLSGVFLGGTSSAVTYYGDVKPSYLAEGQQISEHGGVDSLLAFSADMKGENQVDKQASAVRKQTQKNAQSKGAYEAIGRLSREIDDVRVKQNKSDIAAELQKSGMSKRQAEQYADIISRKMETGEISKAEAKKLTNKKVAETLEKTDLRSVANRDLKHYAARNGTLRSMNDTDAPVNKNAEERQFSAEESTSDEAASVGIAEISSNENGKMMLELSDGSKVAASEYVYSSSDEALVYESLQYMGVDAATANVLVKEYQSGGVSAEVYVRGISEAYAYGQLNLPLSDMSATTFAADLSEQQRSTAYKLGQVFSENKVAAEQKRIDDLKKAAAAPKKGTGKVYDESGNEYAESEQHTERQKASIRALKSLAKALKLDFYIFESYLNEKGERVYKNPDGTVEKAPNGFYDSDGKMHIDLNAGANGEGTMLRTVAHELTHFIKEWSPHKFKVLANFLAETYGKHGQNVAALVRAQQKKAKDNGRKLTFAEAYEEFVADSMQRMLTDGDAAAKIEALNRKDSEIVAKIREFFADLAAKLKAVRDSYKDVKADGFEGEFIKESLAEFDRLQQLFAEALVDAADSYNAVGNEYTKTAEKSSKESARSIVKNRKSAYNEFDSLAMGWAKSADRKSGDVTIFYNGKQKAFVAIRAIAGEYYTLAIGNYEEVRESYERVYSKQNRSLYGGLNRARSGKGSGLWNLQYDEDGGNDAGNSRSLGSAGVQVDAAGNLEYLWGRYRGKSIRRGADFGGALWQTDLVPLLRRFGEEWHGTTIGARRYGRVGNKLVTIEKIAENAFEIIDVYRVENNNDVAGEIIGDMLEVLNVKPDEPPRSIFYDKRIGEPAPEFTKFDTKTGEFRRRFSDRDQSYLQAVSSGDMQTAQRMVDEAAAAAGYTGSYYHGSQNKFTVFDIKKAKSSGTFGKGFYFSDSETHAKQYGNTYKVFLKMENPLRAGGHTVNDADLRKFIEAVAENEDYGIENYGTYDVDEVLEKIESRDAFAIIRDVNTTAIGDFAEAVKLFNEVCGTEFDAVVTPMETVVFKPEQIKSADPVTYDDNGNVIALSERFDSSRKDIRYSDRNSYRKHVEDIDTFDIEEYYGVNIRGSEFNRLRSEAMTWDSDKAGKILRKTLSNGYTYFYSFDSAHDITVYKKIKAKNIHERKGKIDDYRSRDQVAQEDDRSRSGGRADTLRLLGTNDRTAGAGRSNAGKSSEEARDGIGRGYDENGDNAHWQKEKPIKLQDRDLVGYERQRKVAAALAEDKAHLSEDVETRLRALLELQSKRTYGTLFTKSALSKPATDLMLAAGAQYRGDKAELIGLLHDVYSFMASGEDVTWESISEKAQPIVDWLIDHKDFRAEADPYTQQILNDVKALRVSMNEEQRQQTEILNDGMRNFLNKARGKVTFTTKGDPIDKAWKELAGKYPSIFDSEQNSADMPVRLVEIVEELKSEAWNASEELEYEFEQNRELAEQKLLASVYEGYWNIPALKTVADRNQAKIDKLITEHKQEMSDLRAARDRKIGELTAEYRKERAELRREYREREDRKVAEIKTKYQETIEKRKEATAQRELRPKLQALVLDTARWLTSPKKTETPCPDYLKAPYEKFLKSIDLSSKRKLGGGEPTLKDARVAATMNALAMVIERVQLSQNPEATEGGDFDAGYLDLPADFVENLRKTALEIEQSMLESENKAVNDMTSEELRQTILRIEQLNHAIRNMGQTYANARGETVKTLGVGTMSYLDELGVIEKTSKMGDWTVWENGLPYYMFKRFGDAGESVFEELMDGWDKLAFNAKTILDYSEKNWSQKEADTWSNDSRTVKLPSGAEIKLTTADAMLLYLESKQQESLNHLLKSKTVFRGHKKGKVTENDTSAQLSDADITFLVNEFVPKDSRQRQVADKIQWFFVHVSGEQLNEISMKRFLTRPANNPNYCPILVYEGKVPAQDTGKEQADLFRILNVSATKPRVAGANCSIIIRNVFDVFTEHTSDMARLNALGLPLLDSMKWLNYREKTTDAEGHIQEKSVRESMKNAYGNAAFSYIINLIKDINGRAGDIGDPSILKEWMRMAKTANVGNSLRVTLLQISSYPRAAMVLSDKSLVLGLTKLPQIEKAKKYCGIVLWKSFGFFDTNISRSIEEQIRGKRNIRQALIELSLKGPEYADAITLGALWNACEYEVAKSTQNKIGSEEFNEEVGKLLREVVYATQVVDSQLTRSQNMRSKSGLAQEAYAYMSEDTVTANILMEAGYQFYTEKRRTGSAKLALEKTGKHIIRASRITATASLFAVTMGALMAAWYDDDDEEFEEKFRQALKEELLLEAIPLNKIPIFSDILEAAFSLVGVGYFSTDSLHAQWLSQAVSAVNSWKSLGKGTSKSTVYNALYKTARAISSISGVSISGLMREVVSLWNNTFGAADPALKIRKKKQSNKAEDAEDKTEDDRATSQYSTGDMNAALESGDTKQAGVIIDDLLAVKIENYLADGESKKDAETKAKSALKSALTSYWKEIYVSADSKRQYEIRLLLRSTGLYDTNDLIKMCNRWVNEARQEARKKK